MSSPPTRILDEAPHVLRTWQGFRFGQFRGPFTDLDFDLGPYDRLRLKEWQYTSLVTGDFFLAIGLVQLGYAAQLFAYVVDRRMPDRPWHRTTTVPLGRCLRMADGPVVGETLWKRRKESVRVIYDGGWRIDLDLDIDGRRLSGALTIGQAEGLSVLYPIEPLRPAYTFKAAGLPASGEVHFGRERIMTPSVDGLATIDWTRSLASRRTQWKWASFAGRDEEGTRIGLNLSADVYDDAGGASVENAFFIEGAPHALGAVAFAVPARPAVDPWFIRSQRREEVDLRFEPLGARAEDLHLGLLASHLVQPYGHFEGRVLDRRIEGLMGVVEDHLSIW